MSNEGFKVSGQSKHEFSNVEVTYSKLPIPEVGKWTKIEDTITITGCRFVDARQSWWKRLLKRIWRKG